MIKVGVTGGIGSGKSTVCRIFECLGVPVFRADEEGRRLLGEDKEVQKKVASLFGDAVLTKGKPDRKKIAAIVFADEGKLKQLNAIIHPAVKNSFANWLKQQTGSLVIEEAAILFENGNYKDFDAMVLVTAPEALRIKRVTERDHVSVDEIKKRMKNQWSDEEKAAKADHILLNDEESMLMPKVLELVSKLNHKE
jgi:dephospho-CoA kinase